MADARRKADTSFVDDSRWVSISAPKSGYGADANYIRLAHGDDLEPGTFVRVPRTGEIIQVKSRGSYGYIVGRGMGETRQAKLHDRDPLFIDPRLNEDVDG